MKRIFVKKNLIFMAVISSILAIMSLAVAAISHKSADIQYYFHSGAEIKKILKHPKRPFKTPYARAQWLQPTHNKQDVLREVAEHYTGAWQIIINKDIPNKREMYKKVLTHKNYKWLYQSIKPDAPRQVIYNHSLELVKLSDDKKSVIFKDRALKRIQFIKSPLDQDIITLRTTESYDILMTFNEGQWKIDSLVRTNIKNTEELKDVKNIDLKHEIGINYYPAKTPWELFWSQYSHDTVDADFKKIKSILATQIRIFLPFNFYSSQEAFEHNKPKLDHLLATAQKYQLKVILTLFDRIDYSESFWGWHLQSLKTLLQSYRQHPNISMWDIKNEPDLDFKVYEKRHGRHFILAWLETILSTMQEFNLSAPITIGWSTPEQAHLLKDYVHAVSFHYFKKPKDFIRQVQNLVKKTEKSLVLSEFGQHTCANPVNFFRNNQAHQEDYINSILKESYSLGVKHKYIWSYSDFTALPKSMFSLLRPDLNCAQRHMGIFADNGTPKKIAETLLEPVWR